MDYRKIFLYLLIIIVAAGLWLKSRNETSNLEAETERFTAVYAETAVMAELYRNAPKRFFQARDSIYKSYNVDSVWVYGFRDKFEGREEDWNEIWFKIKIKVDSLVDHYKNNPITSQDSVKVTIDSISPQ